MSSISSVGSAASAGLEALAARWQRANSASETKSGDTMAELFKSIDSDGDGSLSRKEFEAAVPSQSVSLQSFDFSAMSTQSFAGMLQAQSGRPPDPIQSLDSNGDDSVSAEEFGLDGASESVQELFKAIDADGSGDLSSNEIGSFREQFMAKAGGAGGPPPSPPPGASGGTATAASGSASSTDSTRNSTSSTDAALRNFLQQLSEMYASQYQQVADAKTQSTSSALNTTA